MFQPESSRRKQRPLIWRIAAFWMVLLSLCLAVSGMILTLQQARSLSLRLTAPAEAEARIIARTASTQFHEKLTATMNEIVTRLGAQQDTPLVLPDRFPNWIGSLLLRTDGEYKTLHTVTPITDELRSIIDEHSAAQARLPADSIHGGPELSYDLIGVEPVAIAFHHFAGVTNRPTILIAPLDLARLKKDLVDPLIPTSGDLEVVRAGSGERSANKPWSQRMFSAMRFWEIQPSAGFLREQSHTVMGQTIIHLAILVLALGTVLVAMWVLVRLVRRDMALAELKANFVADVSHELKTPLALIRMFAETLESGRVTSEEKRLEYYGVIARESTRLTALIENILDFARIEAGRKRYNFAALDIGAAVRETFESYRPQLEHKGFEHHLDIAENLPMVEADQGALAQALINLIGNVMKYSDEERYLGIEVATDTRRGRHGVLISVHDRGIGIKAEDRGQLFDGFYRSADGRVRAQGGTGLGLSVLKHIVDAHGGSLDVESRLVKGSTFRIFLPEQEASGSPPDPTQLHREDGHT